MTNCNKKMVFDEKSHCCGAPLRYNFPGTLDQRTIRPICKKCEQYCAIALKEGEYILYKILQEVELRIAANEFRPLVQKELTELKTWIEGKLAAQ